MRNMQYSSSSLNEIKLKTSWINNLLTFNHIGSTLPSENIHTITISSLVSWCAHTFISIFDFITSCSVLAGTGTTVTLCGEDEFASGNEMIFIQNLLKSSVNLFCH